jgi:pimeloyl-ACP methyl ester carboxylesterase
VPIVSVSGSEVYYAKAGEGPPLLFVHGSGGDHTIWGHQLDALRSEFTVAALDLNGHGRSPWREGDALALYVEDALSVLNALAEAHGPVTLLGHSLGGAVALAAALTKPRGLRALGLIGTGAKLRVHPDILRAIDEDFERAVEQILQWAFAPEPDPELYGRAKEQMLRNGQAALRRDFRACDAFDVRDRLGEIGVPTLVVVGREDRLTPVKYSEYLRDRISGAILEVIEGAGHMVMVERPEALNGAIRRFMSSVSALDRN